MKRLLIADSHLGQREGDGADFLAVLDRAQALQIGELILLGDTFCYLIGFEKFWSPETRMVLDRFAELRASGMRVVTLEGNRDFYLDTKAIRRCFDETTLVLEREIGNQRLRFDHGDRINKHDSKYLFWRAISKSRLARFIALLLPRRLAVKIVVDTERRLRNTNMRFRTRRPEAALRESAAKAWKEGVDHLFWGHFHLGWQLQDGEQRAEIVPAWLETGMVGLIDEDGRFSLLRTREPERMVPQMSEGLTELPEL